MVRYTLHRVIDDITQAWKKKHALGPPEGLCAHVYACKKEHQRITTEPNAHAAQSYRWHYYKGMFSHYLEEFVLHVSCLSFLNHYHLTGGENQLKPLISLLRKIVFKDYSPNHAIRRLQEKNEESISLSANPPPTALRNSLRSLLICLLETWSIEGGRDGGRKGEREKGREEGWEEGERERRKEGGREGKRETAIPLIPSTHLAATFIVIYLFPPFWTRSFFSSFSRTEIVLLKWPFIPSFFFTLQAIALVPVTR